MNQASKVYVATFGCKVNQYDSQVLREQFAASGYEAGSAAEAGLIIVNSCTVTAEADRQCRQLARQLARRNPRARIIVTGCYAARMAGNMPDLGPSIHFVPDRGAVVAQVRGRSVSSISSFQGRSRAFVKVQDGCDCFCSYCIVPHVRSKLWSRPADDAVREIEILVQRGYAEIVLTGVHLGKYAYGLSALLNRLARLPGSFRIRLSSLEITEADTAVIDCIRSFPQRFCPHVHLPLQSASDRVLLRMNRRYTADAFAAAMNNIRRQIPEIAITTDVMVGFPGEDDDDFAATRAFVNHAGFSRLHVFVYSPREGTPAAAFPGRVSPAVARQRAALLNQDDAVLREQYWRRFLGDVRQVIRENSRNLLLTDNYIPLRFNQETHSFSNLLENVRIREINGVPWAE